MTDQTERPPRAEEAGFVMPLALVTIAALALIATISYAAVSRGAGHIIALREDTQRQWAYQEAKAESLFIYLTATPVRGGYYTGSTPEDVVNVMGEVISDDIDENQIWRADGEAIRIQTSVPEMPVLVSQRDASGLAFVNTMRTEELDMLLETIGVEGSMASSLAAKIGDYRDEDSVRRFQGGESADYRLLQLPPPTNSPFRTVGELSQVMTLRDNLTQAQWQALKDTSFVATGNISLNPVFAEPRLASLAAEMSSTSSGIDDVIAATSAGDVQPSDFVRFVLTVDTGGQATHRLVLDVQRSVNQLGKPYRVLRAEEEHL